MTIGHFDRLPVKKRKALTINVWQEREREIEERDEKVGSLQKHCFCENGKCMFVQASCHFIATRSYHLRSSHFFLPFYILTIVFYVTLKSCREKDNESERESNGFRQSKKEEQ